VNGASGLLQAALLALAGPGERVLLPRNLHRSLLHACVLGGIRPLLFEPPFDPATGLWLPPSPDQLARLLQRSGPLKAVVLVRPTYQGLAGDGPGLIAVAHAHGLPVLVDEAHGAHFGAWGLRAGTQAPLDLPPAALDAGADLVVQSLHKSAGGIAQSAALFLQGARVAAGAVERSLLWLQTSSPSALLLASDACALEHLHSERGRGQLAQSLRVAARLRQCLERDGFPLVAVDDPLRLVLHTAAMGLNGLDADAWLLERGVIAELPEPGCLTFCLGMVPPRGVVGRLPAALRRLRSARGGVPLAPFRRPPLPELAEPELAVGQAWRAPSERVPLERSAGRLAAEPLCPYPPGIPLLLPGERIDADRATWLLEQRSLWPGQIADTVSVVA
jgi:lysine decarboxylase